jgi:hypothetical protein
MGVGMVILVIMPDFWLISGIDQASTLKDAMGALRLSPVGPTVNPIYMQQNKSFLAPELVASAEGRSAWLVFLLACIFLLSFKRLIMSLALYMP